MTTYTIFISHSWSYTDAYEKLTKMLREDCYFNFKDYSVPKNDPIHNAPTSVALRDAIRRQMQLASVVLIMAGKYSTYSMWINEEISLAKKGFTYPKPILAITPWGAEQISSVVRAAADKIVRWNTGSIVQGIRELAGRV